MTGPFGWVDEAGKLIRNTDESCGITCTGKLTALYSADQLAACQAREAKLRVDLANAVYGLTDNDAEASRILHEPKDHTALQEAIKQAKREALLEVAENENQCVDGFEVVTVSDLRRMAEEIK